LTSIYNYRSIIKNQIIFKTQNASGMYTEETVLDRGKHKSKKLSDVPLDYLLRLYIQAQYFNDEIKEYIELNFEKISKGTGYRRSTIIISPSTHTCKETPFPTEKDAKYELRRIRNTKDADGKIPVRTYECKICSAWHLTSKPLAKFANTGEKSKCEKRPYDSQQNARNALRKIRRRKNHNHVPIREYKCEFCHKWHLTSQTRR